MNRKEKQQKGSFHKPNELMENRIYLNISSKFSKASVRDKK
jgi:hypothetical protein